VCLDARFAASEPQQGVNFECNLTAPPSGAARKAMITITQTVSKQFVDVHDFGDVSFQTA